MSSAFRPRFFVSPPEGVAPGPGDQIPLSAADERHARRVLRARSGDLCEVVVLPTSSASPFLSEDEPGGRPAEPGRLFSASFTEGAPAASGRLAVLLERQISLPPATLHLILLQALPDLRSVDLVVEKGTEVGVDAFVLFAAQGSPPSAYERSEKKLSRWRRIAEEAAKQSKQVALPAVSLSSSPDKALERAAVWGAQVLVLEPASPQSLREGLARLEPALLSGGNRPAYLALVVGPEGGWSEAELELFSQRGFLSASLGRRILRAETAGPVAAAVARFAFNEA